MPVTNDLNLGNGHFGLVEQESPLDHHMPANREAAGVRHL